MDKTREEVVRQAKLVNETTGNKLFFTGLYGSQNYGLDTETSDVDTHSVILPDFYNLCFGSAESAQLGENTHYKDLREMVKMWKKQSINFLEPLFSDYQGFVPAYKSEWIELMKMRENVARLNPYAFLAAAYGTVHNNLKTAMNTKSTKKLARAWYFMQMAQKYEDEYSFLQVLRATPNEKATYFALRNDTSEEELMKLATLYLAQADKKQNEVQEHKFVVNEAALNDLVEWEYELLKKGVPNVPGFLAERLVKE